MARRIRSDGGDGWHLSCLGGGTGPDLLSPFWIELEILILYRQRCIIKHRKSKFWSIPNDRAAEGGGSGAPGEVLETVEEAALVPLRGRQTITQRAAGGGGHWPQFGLERNPILRAPENPVNPSPPTPRGTTPKEWSGGGPRLQMSLAGHQLWRQRLVFGGNPSGATGLHHGLLLRIIAKKEN